MPTPGRDRRVAHVEIERDVHARRPAAGNRQRLFHHRRDAAAVDVLHREDANARGAHDLLLPLVEIADADQHGVLGLHLRREPADSRQLRRLLAEQRRERHAVDVAAAARRRRVHVAVRVDPDQADPPVAAAHEIRGGRNRAGREAVVAAEHERHAALLESRERRLVQPLADLRDLADVLLLRVAGGLDFRDRRDEIALVDDRHAERGQAFAEAGNPERGGSHVDAAAVAAEIQRHADDVNRPHVRTVA